MRLLFLYCQDFFYTLDHPTKVADKNIQKEKAEYKDAMVVFIAIEANDSLEKVNPAVKEIRKLTRKAQAKLIVLNPFAHLSESLAPPDLAQELLDSIHMRLKETWEDQLEYTSFGWYKSFNMTVSGKENTQVFREF